MAGRTWVESVRPRQFLEIVMSGNGTQSEVTLHERLKGDAPIRDKAIGELRKYLVRGLTKSLSHRYGGRADIDDVTQMALLKILESLDSFQGRSKFETWAMAIAIRVGISELRKRYYRSVSLDSFSKDDGLQIDLPDASHTSNEHRDEQQTMISHLHRLIEEKLSERQRMAIRGSLAGLSVEVIASRLGSNRNAIYKLVHDARLRLRRGLEEIGVTAEDVSSLFSKDA
jgi:RNA polymerase sigma-70 factor (ECF subfamily)